MNKKLLIGLLAIIALLIGLWLILRPSSETAPTTEVLKSKQSPVVKQAQQSNANPSEPVQSVPSKEEQAQSL